MTYCRTCATLTSLTPSRRRRRRATRCTFLMVSYMPPHASRFRTFQVQAIRRGGLRRKRSAHFARFSGLPYRESSEAFSGSATRRPAAAPRPTRRPPPAARAARAVSSSFVKRKFRSGSNVPACPGGYSKIRRRSRVKPGSRGSNETDSGDSRSCGSRSAV